ncbi:MAG: choice-of-anchor Q domain-containing protein [Polyangiales bacterium]
MYNDRNATLVIEGSTISALALGALTHNGGPTLTHGLLPGSVAIDAIPGLMCAVAEDQRGEPRPAGGMCDVGAVEVQP